MDQQTAPGTHGLVLHWAARYDLLAWLLTHGREREMREAIIRHASLETGNDVLDIGCGTGTLAIAATRHVGTTGVVTGIDASPAMIARANRKAGKAGARATFQLAVAENPAKSRISETHGCENASEGVSIEFCSPYWRHADDQIHSRRRSHSETGRAAHPSTSP
jgi:SAM-dependent methyltransferase